jgi:hypothetical protein
MARFETALPSAEHLPFHGIGKSSTFEQQTGPYEWSGRSWLPDGDCAHSAQKFCLVRTDGQLGEMTMDRFSLGGE